MHVYVSANPQLSEVLLQLNTTRNVTLPFRPNFSGRPTVADTSRIPLNEWQPISLLGDTNNGSYPQRPYTLFGYSVALSDDGSWLAVGIPGRTTVPLRQTMQLQFTPYSGAVRIFRRQDRNEQTPSATSPYQLMGELSNPNSGERFWDKFGSKVKWGSVFDKRQEKMRHFLFVIANAGWDGATVKFYNATPDSPYWPSPPTTDVSRAGTYVYELMDSSTTTWSGPLLLSRGGLFNYLQFLPQQSQIPLGSLGIDLAPLVRPSFGSIDFSNPNSVPDDELVLLVRDFVIAGVDKAFLVAQCPNGLCSYITATVNGQTVTYNATGVMLEYVFNFESNLFQLTGDRLQSLDFPVSPYISPALVNMGASPSNWDRNDWFGSNIATSYDSKYDRYMVAVGAPKDASGTYSFYWDLFAGTGDHPTWQPGQFLVNEDKYRRSFFGQQQVFSPDGRFLLVADTAGSGSSLGRGQVFLYYRRSETERMLPDELNNVPKRPIPFAASGVPYFFDKLLQYSKQSRPVTNYTTFRADQFGLGLAANQFMAVMSSPIDQCVYTYAMPVVQDYTAGQPKPPRGPGRYTITRPGPTATSTAPDNQDSNQSQAWIYGTIASGVVLAFLIPAAWFLLKYRLRKKVLNDLNSGKQVSESVNTSEEMLAHQAATRAVSEDNLEGGEHQNSTKTLGNPALNSHTNLLP